MNTTQPTHTLLGPDDVLQKGDEWLSGTEWFPIPDAAISDRIDSASIHSYRRPVPAQTQEQTREEDNDANAGFIDADRAEEEKRIDKAFDEAWERAGKRAPVPSEGAGETPTPQGLKEQLRREQLTRAGIMGNLQDRVVSNVGFDKLWDYFEKEKGILEPAKAKAQNERDAAIKALAEASHECGLAEGKLKASELAASTESDLRDGIEKRCVHEIKLRENAEEELKRIQSFLSQPDGTPFHDGSLYEQVVESRREVERERNEIEKEMESLRLRGCAGTDCVAREEAGRDTARLDELEALARKSEGRVDMLRIVAAVGHLWLEDANYSHPARKTLRAAIDSATTPEGKQP